MATVARTATRSQLPVAVPMKITPGDSFFGPVFRHKNPDGTPIDTSLWTVTGQIYESSACGAATVGDPFTIVMQPGPDFGYRPQLTDVQTAALACGDYWYNLPTEDAGGVKTTYYSGPVPVSEA